jgi:methyl coenzyme M reductase beta subunit
MLPQTTALLCTKPVVVPTCICHTQQQQCVGYRLLLCADMLLWKAFAAAGAYGSIWSTILRAGGAEGVYSVVTVHVNMNHAVRSCSHFNNGM